jgi:hypothetical protein
MIAVEKDGVDGLAFRVVTPPARQRAPLEKDRGPDSRPVVKGKSFDIKNYAGTHDCAAVRPTAWMAMISGTG